MKTHCYLLHWLSGLFIWSCTLWHSTDLYVPANICRFKAGPQRRPGRAGPHSQPRDWLWLVQCQRHPCHRWAGHMKTSTLLSFPPSPALHSPPASLLPSTLTLHLVIKMQGKGNGWTYQSPPSPPLPHSPSLSPKGDELALYPHFVPAHSLFSSQLLHQGQVFVSFKYKRVCYMRSIWLVGGGQWGCKGWDESWLDCKNDNNGVLSIHWLWWYRWCFYCRKRWGRMMMKLHLGNNIGMNVCVCVCSWV